MSSLCIPITSTALALTCFSQGLFAGTCTVPGSHPRIQAAVNDPACSQIELADQSFFEFLDIDRSLSLSGPLGANATVVGSVMLSGEDTDVSLNEFRITSGCPDGALRILDGAIATASGMHIEWNAGTSCVAGLIFIDGFEE